MDPEEGVPQSIQKTLKYHPRGLTVSDIAKEMGINRNSMARYLGILHAEGKVDVKTIGTAKVYSVAQRVPLSAFLCFTKNMIVILDASLTVVQANDQYLKLAGVSKQDLVGKHVVRAALPIVSSSDALSVIRSAGREQVIADIRYTHDGTDLFYQMEAVPTTFEGGEHGLTIVLEDITERKKYVTNMEFLARTATELVDLPAEVDIFQYIAERIIEIIPEARAYIESFDENNRQCIMRAVVDQRFREATRQLLGQDIVGMPIHLSEVISHPLGGGPLAIRDWGAKKFVFYPDLGDNYVSFHDFCFRQIPEEVCEEILRSQNIGMVYEIGLVWEEQLFGMVGIFLSPDEELKDRKVVVSFLRQASIALARRQTENRLRLSEQRLRDIVDLSPLPAALIGSDARYTFVNGKFTETLGYTLHDIPDGKAWFSQAFPDSVQRKEAIIAWKDDPGRSQKGRMQPRTFDVRCKDGTKKTILFHPVTLRDGSHFVTYEDLTTPG